MASTDYAAKIHSPLARDYMNELTGYLPESTKQSLGEYLIKMGIIDTPRLVEVVHSLQRGIPLDSRDGRDHADGANSKMTAAYGYVNGQKTAEGWRIKIVNCEADVLAVFDRPSTGERYEGHFPAKALRGLNHITLTDCKRGGPLKGKWGRYLTKVK